MKTKAFWIGVLWIAVAVVLAGVVSLFFWSPFHSGHPVPFSLGLAAVVCLLPSAGLLGGGVAYLVTAFERKPYRKEHSPWTLRNILITSYPGGCELLRIMEEAPDISAEIITLAYASASDRRIQNAAWERWRQLNASGAPLPHYNFPAAMEQARIIYPRR